MIFSQQESISNLFKKTFTAFLISQVLLCLGCMDNDNKFHNNSADTQKTVFADISFPATLPELEKWLQEISSKPYKIRSQIVNSKSLDFENHLIPLYNVMIDLSDNLSYSVILMNKYSDVNGRVIANKAYQLVQKIQDEFSLDEELKTSVLNALNRLTPVTEIERTAGDYLKTFFQNKYNRDQIIAISNANNSLMEVSLAFYNNAISKNSSALFKEEDFSCLPKESLSKIPRDESGNYIINSNNTLLLFSLIKSCVEDPVRERLHSLYVSKAAKENSSLWPMILDQRITYANAYGFEDFLSVRLSKCMFQTASQVKTLLKEVKTITDPKFQSLKTHYKNEILSDNGQMPDKIYVWHQIKYKNKIKEKLSGSVPLNPKLLTYPDTFENMLYLIGKIIGLKFVKSDEESTTWNNGVDIYLVYEADTDSPVGTLLVDPYKIENVNDVASAQLVKSSRILKTGEKQGRVVALKANLNKPDGSSKIYLASSQYITLGHELGHAMHHLLKKDKEECKTDFYEIPSIFFEKLICQKEFFKAVLSNDPDIPLQELPNDFETYWNYYKKSPGDICDSLRYNLTASGIINDLAAWKPGDSTDLGQVAKQNLEAYFYPYSDTSSPFYDISHVINPLTDANYYLYLLGIVISEDFLNVFKSSRDNIFDRETGNLYRKYILENSGTDSEDDIRSFLGRDWNYDAFKKAFDEKTAGL